MSDQDLKPIIDEIRVCQYLMIALQVTLTLVLLCAAWYLMK